MTISPSSSARVISTCAAAARAISRRSTVVETGRRAADAGEGEQVVDQALHALRAVDGEADVLVGPLVELPAVAALQELAEAGDLAQRLLQVVARDVGELLEVAVGPLQVAGLVVEPLVDLLEQVAPRWRCAPASRRRPRRARRSPGGRCPGPPGARRPTPRRAPGPRAPRPVGGPRGAGPTPRRRGRRRSPTAMEMPTHRSASAALLSRSRAATRSASRTAAGRPAGRAIASNSVLPIVGSGATEPSTSATTGSA